ncbi:hypothetical protein LY76DRAFT_603659 [Colletotrichum caudatum]|nr:hypothetical protein LY76DRAFT_603659 [Colletotrichum caudatum]
MSARGRQRNARGVGALLPARLDADVRVTMLVLNRHSVELFGLSFVARLGDQPHLVLSKKFVASRIRVREALYLSQLKAFFGAVLEEKRALRRAADRGEATPSAVQSYYGFALGDQQE